MSADAPGRPTVTLFARSARFWMRAYPRRWRAQRGAELYGLLLDLAGPDARRVGARAAFDLVRGGWATRWRRRPPVHSWLLYRTFDRRIPEGYRGWAQDDIEGRLFPLRQVIGGAWWVFPWILVQDSAVDLRWLFLGIAALSIVLGPDYFRRQHLLKHVAPQVGEPVAEGGLVTQPMPRRRVAARPCFAWCVAVAAPLLAAGVVTTAIAPVWVVSGAVLTGEVGSVGVGVSVPPIADRAPALAAIAAGLLVGLWCACVAHRRLLRCLDVAVDQPYRALVPRVSGTGVARLVVGVGAALLWMSAEVRGDLPLAAGVLVSVICLVLLPVALVGLRAVAPTASDVAGSDVWTIVVHGRPPAEDVPLPALRPLVGPVPAGAVMVRAHLGESPSVALPEPPSV